MEYAKRTDFTPRFKRVHSTGTEAHLKQHSNVWRIQINLREPNQRHTTITGYVPRSLSLGKEVASKELLKYGHVCNEACKDWVEITPV